MTAPRRGPEETNDVTKVVEAYFGLLKLTLVLCLAGMDVLVFGNVLLRYALAAERAHA